MICCKLKYLLYVFDFLKVSNTVNTVITKNVKTDRILTSTVRCPLIKVNLCGGVWCGVLYSHIMQLYFVSFQSPVIYDAVYSLHVSLKPQ